MYPFQVFVNKFATVPVYGAKTLESAKAQAQGLLRYYVVKKDGKIVYEHKD